MTRARLGLLLLTAFLASACGARSPWRLEADDVPGDSGGAVQLAWSPVDKAEGYRVYRAEPGSERFELVAQIDETKIEENGQEKVVPPVAEARDGSAVAGVAYRYRVSAILVGEEGAPCDPVVAASRWNVDAADRPGDFGGTIALGWPPAGGASGYRVYRALHPGEGGAAPAFALIGETAGTSFADPAAEVGVAYDYQVAIVQGAAEVGRSGTVTAASEPNMVAADREKDFGGAIDLRWPPVPDATRYRLFRAAPGSDDFEAVATLDGAPPPNGFRDDKVDTGVEYRYRLTWTVGGVESPPTVAVTGKAEGNWFKTGFYNNFLVLLAFSSILLGWIWAASKRLSPAWIGGLFLYTALYCLAIALQHDMTWWQAVLPLLGPVVAITIPILTGRSSQIYIRPIPAIQAVEEAIGRATEMGKPILFVPGISVIDDVATLAALNILAPVAEKAAQYDSKLIVPNYDAIVYTVAQEVVKEAYLKAGRPDSYSDENVFFLSARQFAYAAAVNGIMVREKPATNFFLGTFYAESLLLAETGNMTGAIQIAGTDMVTQLPFFIVACDFTLIGEELYAAGAYMGGDPKLTGSLKGQDWSKGLALVLLVLFTGIFLVVGLAKKVSYEESWNQTLRQLPSTLFEPKEGD